MAKKCLHCGDSMPEEANICLHCFTICDNTASDSENAKTKKRKKPTKKQIAILVTAVACLLVILPLGAMQIDQAIAPTTSANTAAFNANTNAKENNPVSRFFKKVLGIEEEAEDTDTSNGAPNGGKGQSAPNTTDVAANNNASASKENTESNNTIQNKPSGSGSDNNTSASTEPEEEETPILNYSDYEYETDYDGEIKITKYTGNDSEVAAVIANEMGHIINGTYSKNQMRNAAKDAITSNLGSSNILATAANSDFLANKTSLSDEKDADITGIDLMVKTNYNPLAMVVVITKRPGSTFEALQGKPANTERAMNVFDYLTYNYPEKVKAGYGCQEYRAFLEYANPIVEDRNSSKKKLDKFNKEQKKNKAERAKKISQYKSTGGISGWDASYTILKNLTAQ